MLYQRLFKFSHIWILFGLTALSIVTSIHIYASTTHEALARTYAQISANRDTTPQIRIEQLNKLYQNLPKDADVKLRANILFTLEKDYRSLSKPTEAEKTIQTVQILARSLSDPYVLSIAQMLAAKSFFYQGKFIAALNLLDEAREDVEGAHDLNLSYNYCMSYSDIYLHQNLYEKSIEKLDEALVFAKKIDAQNPSNAQAQASVYYWLASNFVMQEDYEQALKMIAQGMSSIGKTGTAQVLSDLYAQEGGIYLSKGDYDRTLNDYQQALRIAKEARLEESILSHYINMANLYLHKKDYTKAEEISRMSLAMATESQHAKHQTLATINLGFALGYQGDMSQASAYLLPHFKSIQEKEHWREIDSFSGKLSELYEYAGMQKEALHYARIQQKAGQHLLKTSRAQSIALAQKQFEIEKRQIQTEALARETTLQDTRFKNSRLQLFIFVLATAAILLGGLFIYALYRRTQRSNLKLQEVNERLAFHVVRDPLTGLHNRRSFSDLIKTRHQLAMNQTLSPNYDEPINPDCLILLDIDHFKMINDHYGHSVGDAVLVEIAKRLRSVIRDSDVAYRWGGEEFLIFASNSKLSQHTQLVGRILKTIGEKPVKVGHQSLHITMSAGFISLPFLAGETQEKSWEKAMIIADSALYMSKLHGRNCAYGVSRLNVTYSKALPILESDMTAAVEKGLIEIIALHGPQEEGAEDWFSKTIPLS